MYIWGVWLLLGQEGCQTDSFSRQSITALQNEEPLSEKRVQQNEGNVIAHVGNTNILIVYVCYCLDSEFFILMFVF